MSWIDGEGNGDVLARGRGSQWVVAAEMMMTMTMMMMMMTMKMMEIEEMTNINSWMKFYKEK